jgi:hypothetical protein
MEQVPPGPRDQQPSGSVALEEEAVPVPGIAFSAALRRTGLP